MDVYDFDVFIKSVPIPDFPITEPIVPHVEVLSLQSVFEPEKENEDTPLMAIEPNEEEEEYEEDDDEDVDTSEYAEFMAMESESAHGAVVDRIAAAKVVKVDTTLTHSLDSNIRKAATATLPFQNCSIISRKDEKELINFFFTNGWSVKAVGDLQRIGRIKETTRANFALKKISGVQK